MLGDSITQEGSWEEDFPSANIVNRGVGGNTTRDILDRLEATYPLQPRKLFLLVGVNDLNMDVRPEQTLANYEAIVRNLRQHLHATTIFLQSVLPVDRRWSLARNVDIRRLNEHIEELANYYQSSFIDLHSHFSGSDGEMHVELSNDGLHLNRRGYALWCRIIRPFMDDQP